MLRFISVIGIAIAMLVGFIAISTKMKDDYTVRSRVVSVLKQMKNLASEELQCGITSDANEINPSHESSADEKPAIEMSTEIETKPLIENTASGLDDPKPQNQSEISHIPDMNEHHTASPEIADSATLKRTMNESITVEGSNFGENADVIKAISYRNIESNEVEMVVSFNEIKGESGKTHIKSDSQIIIHCTCLSETLSCSTIESNIGKNYLPKSLTR